ncbi:DNA repair protein RAD51 homolog 4-like [Hydractinia symbiolongicarpus]|uniref:DNA repair protein RAD51 homolog 4-like n=1 Tax=Hydractinia symbiolongicarpus TaxID=13093 RepID=UPI00254D2400|nr:DNA repair protein RAD51 homolog 4-like [Hydractinia symbiolongicarpus]
MSLLNILEKLKIDQEKIIKMKDQGISTVLGFLQHSDNDELMNKATLTQQEVNLIRENLFAEHAKVPIRGTDLYKETMRLMKILPTACSNLDELLHGGLFTTEMLEVYGPPAVGKTQMCLQVTSVAISAQQANVVYMDTTGSFTTTRLVEMIESNVKAHSPPVMKDMLSRVLHCRIFDAFGMTSQLECLKEKLESEVAEFCSHVKLLIVDSIASVITPILGGQQQHGHAIMSKIGLLLKQIAYEYGIAVLVVNNAVTDDFKNTRQAHRLKPSLGKSWLSVPHVRLFMDVGCQSEKEKIITIVKHHRMPTGVSTAVHITSSGLRNAQKS